MGAKSFSVFLEAKLIYKGCAKMFFFLLASNFFIFHANVKLCTSN